MFQTFHKEELGVSGTERQVQKRIAENSATQQSKSLNKEKNIKISQPAVKNKVFKETIQLSDYLYIGVSTNTGVRVSYQPSLFSVGINNVFYPNCYCF